MAVGVSGFHRASRVETRDGESGSSPMDPAWTSDGRCGYIRWRILRWWKFTSRGSSESPQRGKSWRDGGNGGWGMPSAKAGRVPDSTFQMSEAETCWAGGSIGRW